MSKKKLTRKTVIRTLVNSLKPIDYIRAFWEGGAAAFNHVDQWSDIDLYLIVQDDKIEDTVHEVEQALKSLSPIEHKYETQQKIWPEIFQVFYKIENASPYLLIDLAVIKMSSPEKFLEPEIHGNAVFHFNKLNKIEIPYAEDNTKTEKLRQRIGRLKARFDIFNIFVQKEINRGNALEALDLYYNITLAILTGILRIKYSPLHHDFKTRYIYSELPESITHKLENLFFVRDMNDLQRKYNEATKWYNEIILSSVNWNTEEHLPPKTTSES